MPHSRGVSPRLRSSLRAAGGCALGLTVSSCAGPRPTVAVAPRSACAIAGAQPAAGDTISVASIGPIEPSHAPVPANRAERFVFAQLYETLIDVDCEGHPYPGLAKSWTLDATGTRITLSLRDGARFWNGKPVVASDVVTAWRVTGAQSSEPARLAARLADAVTIVDDRTLTVSLPPPDTAWRVLAEPVLAVYQPPSGAGWAAGTASYQVAVHQAARGGLLLEPVSASAAPSLSIRPLPTGDARDAIDRGIDVLVTADPLAIDYAAPRSSLTAIPLPWSRTYVLAVPPVASADSALLRPLVGDSATAVRGSFARDAVRVEARAAEPPYWWSESTGCQPTAPASAPARSDAQQPMRIAYDARDPVARRLAERLVALGGHAVAVPLASGALARALRDGTEPAYVLGLARSSLDACNDVARLDASAPWLRASAGDVGGSLAAHLVPLIDTRERAIVNRDHVSAMIDWDGTLRFGGTSSMP